MIDLDDVSIAAGGRVLVEAIDATLEPGRFVAVLGPNGVGKTTLLRAIAGLGAPHAGRIVVNGRDIHALSPRERAHTIAFVTSDDVMTEALRVEDIVAMGRFPHHPWWEWSARKEDADAVDAALDAVRMTVLRDRLFTTLSSGERQRAWIAMGLAQSTPVVLLDEPTSHLDVRVSHEILALLRRLAREGRTIVCVLHDLNDAAAYADRLMLLGCERMLAFAAPEETLTPELLERAYGVRVRRVETPEGPRVFAATADA